jgi:hypothetical protein
VARRNINEEMSWKMNGVIGSVSRNGGKALAKKIAKAKIKRKHQ